MCAGVFVAKITWENITKKKQWNIPLKYKRVKHCLKHDYPKTLETFIFYPNYRGVWKCKIWAIFFPKLEFFKISLINLFLVWFLVKKILEKSSKFSKNFWILLWATHIHVEMCLRLPKKSSKLKIDEETRCCPNCCTYWKIFLLCIYSMRKKKIYIDNYSLFTFLYT